MKTLPDTLQAISTHIKLRRKELGLTLRDLSRSTGASISTLSRLEGGDGTVAFRTVLRLCHALGIPLAGVFDQGHLSHETRETRPPLFRASDLDF